ncbi:hypothetical protein Rsw2DRAFT_0820 [Rhodobacter ferrooxidans]|uniref:Uncharacterized protein n=2 Tax=Rhodobacter ferrooxidans TaxID=371731 RepID=C8RYE2_9RHOB|nr:hypothetical protein Rsw2DRAFT_0820 [Rhodobacter sp. SW2]
MAACTLIWQAHGKDFRLDYTPAANAAPMQWVVTGAAVQTLPFNDPEFQVPPTLADLDEDGWPDLWRYLGTGNVNSSFEIFHFNPDRRAFVSLGELGGVDIFRDQDGMIVASARESCCAWGVARYRLTGDRLVPQFGLRIESGETDADPVGCAVFSIDQDPLGRPAEPLSIAEIPVLTRQHCTP